jgi:hypothetical protein
MLNLDLGVFGECFKPYQRVMSLALGDIRLKKRGTHQTQLQRPDTPRPEFDGNIFRRIFRRRNLHLQSVPPALSLYIQIEPLARAKVGFRLTAGFRQKSRSFWAVAIWE